MNLYLPKPTATPHEVAESHNTVKALKLWSEGLSIVNTGETARDVYKTLQTLNRQSLDPKLRFQLSEIIRPISRQILNYLQKQTANMTLPLSRRSQQIDQLIHALLRELANSYKLTIHDMDNSDEKLQTKVIAACIHRALRYIGEAMTQHERTYTTLPDSLWHDAHRLYSFAEKHKAFVTPIMDRDYRTLEHSTVLDVYKQMCVLFLCQPFRLRHAQVDELRRFLESAVAIIDLKKSLIADDLGAVFVSSLRSSEGPAYVPLADITTFSNLRGFDFTEFFEYLRNRSAGLPGDKRCREELSQSLAARVLHILGQQEKRRFSRVVTSRSVTVACGLKNILDAIQADTQPELTREQLFNGENPSTEQDGERSPSHGSNADETLTGLSFDGSSLYGDFFTTTVNEQPTRTAPESWQLWQITNSGATGYGLQWGQLTPCHASVGELIAVREKEYNLHHWRIGVVRWIRNLQPESIDIGVEVLAPRALVVSAPTPSDRQSIDALMLPGLKAIEEAPSMIVPANIFTQGDRLDIKMLEKDLSIELRSIGESPGTFTQFFYKARQVAKKAQKKENFDDLWSKL